MWGVCEDVRAKGKGGGLLHRNLGFGAKILERKGLRVEGLCVLRS